MRWAKWSLERVRVKAGRGEAGRPLEHGDVFAHQLDHFVNTLHQFVMDRLLHGAWLELEQVGNISTCSLAPVLSLFDGQVGMRQHPETVLALPVACGMTCEDYE